MRFAPPSTTAAGLDVDSDGPRVRLRVLRRGGHGTSETRPRLLFSVGWPQSPAVSVARRTRHRRDPDVDIQLDESTVSRRHARLLVTADRAVLEDFDSKNGTLRGGEPVMGQVALADGDALDIGALILTFHRRPPLLSSGGTGPEIMRNPASASSA
jgi:hypothetical protein